MWIEGCGGGGGTQITPSDATPVALVNGETYEAGSNGYAIETNPNDNQITPTVNGASFTSGIKKMLAGGYAYSQRPSEGYAYLTTKTISVSNKVGSLTGLTAGKEYYMIVDYAWSNANYNADITSMTNTSDLAEVSSTQERVTGNVAAYLNQSIHTFKATSTSSNITFTTMSTSGLTVRVTLFEK